MKASAQLICLCAIVSGATSGCFIANIFNPMPDSGTDVVDVVSADIPIVPMDTGSRVDTGPIGPSDVIDVTSPPTDSGTDVTPPPRDGGTDAGPMGHCSPACLPGQRCDTLNRCVGAVCPYVQCPDSATCRDSDGTIAAMRTMCCREYGSGSNPVSWGAGCSAGSASFCGEPLLGPPPSRVCTLSPSNTMHCRFAEGSIDCPALWIGPYSTGTDDYVEGCCGVDGSHTVFCGTPGITGSGRECGRPDSRYRAAP